MSPDPPLDATGIARRQFSTARKGYDTGEVRAFLHEIADLLGRLQREGAHEHERAERAETRATLAEQLDEHRLVELLGEETARVLDAARAAGSDIRSKAEDSAARLVREAQAQARGQVDQAEKEAAGRKLEILAEADALRREAEDEVERRRGEGQVVADELRRDAEVQRERMLAEGERGRAEAEAAAEQIRAAARDQGRRLVGEAQAVRERMLADLARRRRSAREQLERLNGARERLLAAYEVVKRTVDEATIELTVALPEAKAAAESAMRRVSEEPEDTVEVLEAELTVARMAGLDSELADAEVSDDDLERMIRELAEEEAAQAAAAAEAEAASGGPGAESGAPADADRGAPGAEPGATAAQPQGTAAGSRGVDAAGAGAAGTGNVGTPAADVGAPAQDPSPPRTGPPGGPLATAEPRAQTDAERWGVRLPRSRRSAATPTRSPVAVAVDESESDQHVGELFARIRAERSGGDADAGSDRAAADGGAVAVAVRADAPVAGGVDVGTVEPDTAAGDAADTETAADTSAAADMTAAAETETDADIDEHTETEDDTELEPVDPVTAALQGRDTLLAGVERELGRRLKRVLADEQNEVLDTLRRGGTVEFDDVVPASDEHADRFAIAATPHLDAAAGQGAAQVAAAVATGDEADEPAPAATRVPSCDELAGELGRDLVDPLRVRIRRSFDDCDGDVEEVTERLRALYREWKGQHIGEAVRHFTVAAYARGAYHSTPDGSMVAWLVDPSCLACPDCDDNALAAEVAKGEAFPTGDRCAPAHGGCRCLVVPAAAVAEPPAGR